MMERELPVGWSKCHLSELVVNVIKIDKYADQELLIEYVDISAIDNELNVIGETKSFFIKDAPSRARQIIKSGDVLFSLVRPYLKNIAAVPDRLNNQIASTGFCVLRPSTGLDGKFIFYKVTSGDFINSVSGKQYGVSYPAVKEEQVIGQVIGFPPLNEQKRIVAKIEELFSELDNGINALKTAREQLKVYRQAVLKHAFEGKLTAQWREENSDKLESPEQLLALIQQEREARYQQQLEDWKAAVKAWEANGKEGKKPGKPKKYTTTPLTNGLAESLPTIPNSWKWVSFSELLFSIRGGTTFPPIDTPTDLPILRSSSIRAGRLNLEDIRYLPEDSKISDDDYLNFSDLLFSRLNGTLEFVGVCASVPSAIPKNLLYPDRLYCAKLVNSEMVKSCEYYFSSPYVRRDIEKRAKSTAGHKRISIPDVSEQPIPIFDSGEMKELVNLLSEKFSLVDKLQDEIEKSLSDSETLRQSILKKAFSGQLVPQDPNDEPASELLARIQAEKAAEKANQKAAAKPNAKLGAKRGRKPKVAS